MTISNVRDPRDSLPDILSPLENVPCLDETAYLERETGIDGLRVLFNRTRQKFVIQDTKAPGGPSASFVKIIQNPDGSSRQLDNRDVEWVRKSYGRHKESAEELIRMEIERERRNKTRREEVAYGVADDLRWVGTDVVPSVAWDARSSRREQIRKEAAL